MWRAYVLIINLVSKFCLLFRLPVSRLMCLVVKCFKVVLRKEEISNHSELESPADDVKKKSGYVNVIVSCVLLLDVSFSIFSVLLL